MKKVLILALIIFVASIGFASKPNEEGAQIDYINKYLPKDSWIRIMHNVTPERCCCGLKKSSARKGCDTINSLLHLMAVGQSHGLELANYDEAQSAIKRIFPHHSQETRDIEFTTFSAAVKKIKDEDNNKRSKKKKLRKRH